MKILVVEDQRDLGSMMRDRLGRSGYVVDCVGTIAETLEALRAYDYPVLLLDRRLPDGDGMNFLPQIRSLRPSIRVLMVTALRSIDDRINGLDAGADDYLVKPFAADELLARVRASLRRPGAVSIPTVSVGALSFDLNQREAYVNGRPLILPKRELLLLETLMRRAGRAVMHSTIIDEIYGLDEQVQNNALKMLASRLRQRLRDAGAGVDIYATRSVGYLIAPVRV
ncbi:response regulator transcription factor [Methylocystis sp. 9N]|uniref:Response regulator transcription factor n=1 Tax=Methylocystis borbori TaxID=3118750 RepID=A0ABU7XCK0_9HYPH